MYQYITVKLVFTNKGNIRQCHERQSENLSYKLNLQIISFETESYLFCRFHILTDLKIINGNSIQKSVVAMEIFQFPLTDICI